MAELACGHQIDEEVERLVTALMSFQRDTQPAAALAPRSAKADFLSAGRTFVRRRNCVGCHIIEGDGGDFLTLVADSSLGPPMLTPEGARVQPEWLYAFLRGPITIRPWLSVRMPTFGLDDPGARALRGGAFKPRSSPYSFQGHGEEALKLLREAGEKFNLLVISEVMEISQIPRMMPYVDIFQVGARNMQNFNLLREIGKVRKPAMLKRGIAATLEELLLSAEYIMSGGNYELILCERGIRTFENSTRNTMDISAIPVVKSLSHLPIVADPSHGTGRRDKVLPILRKQAGFVDEAVLTADTEPNRLLALSFWNTREDAERYHREQYQKITEMLSPLVENVPTIRTFNLHTPTWQKVAVAA